MKKTSDIEEITEYQAEETAEEISDNSVTGQAMETVEKPKPGKAKKKILIISGIILLAVIALVLVLSLGGKKEDTVITQKVESVISGGGFTNRYNGVVETQKTEDIQLDTSRTVSEIYVTEGANVKKGDRLFSYDSQSINLEIRKIEAEIEFCNANIQNAQEQIEQIRQVMYSGTPAEQMEYSAQIQQLQADIAQEELNIKTKNADIETKKNSLNSATVTATISGTVRKIADMDTLDSDNPDMSNVFISIVGEGGFRIKGSIGEQNIMEINVGTKVIVRSRVDLTATWQGEISSIQNQSDRDENQEMLYETGESSTKYPFYVELKDTNGLMLGQHVTIEPDFSDGETKDGIWLSSGWLIMDGEDCYVLAADGAGQKPSKRKVQTGEYDEITDEYEIVSGLKLSDYIAWP